MTTPGDQAGKTLTVSCPQCQKKYPVPVSKIPAAGARLTCKQCGHKWKVRRPKTPADQDVSTARMKKPDLPGQIACPSCGHRFVPPRSLEVTREDPAAAAAAAGKPVILIVDDQAFFREMTEEILNERYHCLTADTAAAAIRILDARSVDLIVLDLTMEEENAGERVLERAKPKQVPVLVLTGRPESDLIGGEWNRLQEMGAGDLIIKGINIQEQLENKVRDLLAPPPKKEEG